MRWFLLALVVLVGCAGQTEKEDVASLIVTHDQVSLSVCGDVIAFEPATATAEGTLALDARTWTIAPSTTVDATLLTPNDAVCVRADLDSKRRIVACTITPAPGDPWAAAGLE